MKKQLSLGKLWMIMLFVIGFIGTYPVMAQGKANQKIYDYASLLTPSEAEELETLSNEYSQKREVDIVILTTMDTKGKEVMKYMEDFYDEQGLGYDKPHGNTAILTIDMQNRKVYVAGFYKGEKYLDNSRCELIREKITLDLTDGNYYDAFQSFIKLSYRYMGVRPGVNPENILFKLWFQLLVAIGLAGIIVTMMVYNSGGAMTAGENTYLDPGHSTITNRNDTYIRTHTSRHKKPSNNGGGGGGGGGTSGGGHSHSGSGGSF